MASESEAAARVLGHKTLAAVNYRMWIGDDDMGTASERAARMWLEQALKHDDDARIEPVADDAPTFLPRDDEPPKTAA